MASPIYGTAFIQIQPGLKGFGASLTHGIGGAIGTAGNAAGSELGKSLLKGFAALKIGQLIVGQITSSIDESIKFESAFAGVLKTVDATVGQLDQLRTGIIDMAKVLPASREEIAGVAEAAGQLGIQTEAILDFTKVMIDLGETTDLTADQAATAFAQIANVMQTPQTMFENMASALVDLGNKGASTESQIIDFAQRIAGAGEIAGLAESDVLAIGSAMASVGIEAEAGGTAVQKVLLGITEAVATTNSDLEVFAETAGLSADEFAKAWGEDAAGAFTLFVEGLARAGDGAFQILGELDLQDQRLIRSFLSLSNAGGLLREQIEIGTTAWDDNTAAATEANKRYETSAARLEVVKNRATELQRQFGDQLVPIIVDLAEEHIPNLENAFADLTESIPGEADLLDFVNVLSTIPRGLGLIVDNARASFNTFTGLVEGFSSVLTVGLVGDTQSALDRITGAWDDFAQNNVFRTATQSMVQALREGEEPALALANALAFVGRRGKIDPKVVRTLTQIADVDPSQLVLELERLVELGPELGLGADDIDAVRVAILDLGPPSIEAVRQANLLARGGAEVGEAFRGVPANLKPAESAFTDLLLAAAEADLTFSELVDPANDAGAAIFGMLDPTEQLTLKLQLLNDGLISASDAFSADLRPTLIDVQEGLQDLNENGQVSLSEFSKSLETAARDFLDFMVDIAAIAAAGAPELAAAVEALGEDAGGDIADLLAKADEDEVLSIAEKLLGSPEQLGKAFQEIYQEGLEAVDGGDAAAIAAWLGFVSDTFEEDLPGITAIMVEAFQPSLDAAINSLRPPDLNPILKAAIAEIRLTEGATAFQRVFDFLTNALDIDLSQPGLDSGRTYFGGILEAVESREADLLEATNVDLTESGRYSGRTYMGGMLETIESRERDLRTTISGTLNRAIYADSPPKLFLDAGDASGDAFWSGFSDVEAPTVTVPDIVVPPLTPPDVLSIVQPVELFVPQIDPADYTMIGIEAAEAFGAGFEATALLEIEPPTVTVPEVVIPPIDAPVIPPFELAVPELNQLDFTNIGVAAGDVFRTAFDALATVPIEPPDLVVPEFDSAIFAAMGSESGAAFVTGFDQVAVGLEPPIVTVGEVVIPPLVLPPVPIVELPIADIDPTALTSVGLDAGAAFITGVAVGTTGGTAQLRESVLSTLDAAIERSSPPRIFWRAGQESNEAFWMGYTDHTRQIVVDPPIADFAEAGISGAQTFARGFTEEIRRFEGQFSLGPGFDQLTAEQVLSLNLDPATPVFTGFDPLTVRQLQQLVDEAAGTAATEIQFDVDLQALQEDLAALAEVTGIVGVEARAALMVGLSTLNTEEITRLRTSILDTVNQALDARSPSRLFLSVGEAAGDAFWSGFADVNQIDSFGVDGQRLIGRLRQSGSAVSFDSGGGSGGISIGSFSVSNPIGEPTEESVQSALLEVAISPVVNRLVSAGSSL